MNPALEFCMSACVSEMGGDYNYENRCNQFQKGIQCQRMRKIGGMFANLHLQLVEKEYSLLMVAFSFHWEVF